MFLTTAAPKSWNTIEKNLSVKLGLEGGATSDEGGVFMAQVAAYLGGTEAANGAEGAADTPPLFSGQCSCSY